MKTLLLLIILTLSIVEMASADSVWVLLEPPNDKDLKPIKNAPLKQWRIPAFGPKGTSGSYFDTKGDCEAHRKTMWFGDEKICFPLEEFRRITK
jgi:hypothetical protein